MGIERTDAKRLSALGNELARIAGELASFRGNREDLTLDERELCASDFRKEIRYRRLRGRIFPGELFADPAWDMLLELAARHGEGVAVSLTGLCEAIAVAHTTGFRWVAILEEHDLIEREPDPNDKRRVCLRLTDGGLRKMSLYTLEAREFA